MDFIRITLLIKQVETRAGGMSKNVVGGYNNRSFNGLCFKVILALKAVEVDLKAFFFKSGAMPVPTKLQNPTVCEDIHTVCTGF